MTKTIKRLYDIAEYYTKKYNLKDLEVNIVNNYGNCFFRPKYSNITINLKHLENKNISAWKRIKTNNITLKNLTIWALLHELKHAIEHNKKGEIYTKQYLNDEYIDHDKRPLEIEADNWANQELVNWV